MEHLQARKLGIGCRDIGLATCGTCCKIKNSAPLVLPPRVRNDLQVKVVLIVWKQKERLKVDD